MPRVAQRGAKKWHIHIINFPDVEAYVVRSERLQDCLAGLVQEFRLNLTITEGRPSADVSQEMKDAHVLLGFNIPCDRVRELQQLRWIHIPAAGVDHLLPFSWLPKGITVTNSSGIHAMAAEFAICALFMLNSGVPRHAANQRLGRWLQVFNTPIEGKTVVIIGVGAIGGAAARNAKQFGLRVIGVRYTQRSHKYVDEMVGPEALVGVLPRADFVLVTAPLTPETQGMLGRRELDLLKRDAGLVCMSRAGLVDYEALAEKLERGSLRGAIIDVTDPEPLPPDSHLWNVKNLIITPHISSDPVDYAERVIAVFGKNFRRLLSQQKLINRVDTRRGY